MDHEIGRPDITTEVSMLAATMASPREGNLCAVFYLFSYLKNKHNASWIYDPSYPRIEANAFKSDEDWRLLYAKVNEAILPSAPFPRGRSVMIRIYVNAFHAGKMVTRGSRIGLVQFSNNAVVN
jgi:hypothetical protein